MPKQGELSDAPRIDVDDQLTLQQASRNVDSTQDSNSLNARIKKAMSQMSNSGVNAELDYQATLRELASEPQATMAAIAEIHRATPEDQYIERWSQVHLLTDLRNENSLPIFDNILSTPIPPEKAPDMILHSTVGEEVMIRTTAIEGITRLATKGDRQALALLRKHIQHESFSVKRAAIQGYLEAAGEGSRDELRKVLPEKDHFILDIKRAEVQDVLQPDIERTSDEEDQVPPAQIPSMPRIDH